LSTGQNVVEIHCPQKGLLDPKVDRDEVGHLYDQHPFNCRWSPESPCSIFVANLPRIFVPVAPSGCHFVKLMGRLARNLRAVLWAGVTLWHDTVTYLMSDVDHCEWPNLYSVGNSRFL
jgi:hypothetical protein